MLAGMSRRRLLPAARAALLVAGCAVLIAGCSQAIDSDKAERTIARLVRTKIGAHVARVDCPSGKTAHKGDTFTCRVTGKDGSAADAVVTETDDEGTVRVTARFLSTEATERALAGRLGGRGKPTGVDCQDIILASKDVRFDCVTSSSGRDGRVRARIDARGHVRYRPVKGS